MRLEPVERCPVCGAVERGTAYSGLGDRLADTASEPWTLHRCLGCGSLFLDPRPADDSLHELYASYYTHAPPALPTVPRRSVARAGRALRNGYVNARFGYELVPALALGAAVVPLLLPYGIYARRVFRDLVRGRRLLDVGCGNGDFVALAQDAGWEATGIDLDETAVAQGVEAGLDLRVAAIRELAAARPGPYDAVTMGHALEHVPDPVDTLRCARDLLRPGGVIWLATPNLAAPGHRLFGRDWIGLDPPRHLVVFTWASLCGALASAGFAEVRRGTPGLWARENFLASDATARARRGARPRATAPRARLYDFLSVLRPERYAEELVVLASR